MNPETLIELLELTPLPMEGGYFRETYRSPAELPASAPGPDRAGTRSLSTAIYYLLTPDTCSRLHRLPGDEVFHFYLGDPVEMLHLLPDGTGRTVVLGNDLASGMQLQAVVPGGTWQGSRLRPGGRFALLGTTMAPGFDFADFEAGDRTGLSARYPAFSQTVRELTP